MKKEEKQEKKVTNSIGHKGRQLNLDSNVSMLAIKCYEEQLPRGWEYTKQKIKEMNSKKYQVLAIKHDRDTVTKDGFFKPATEKPHFHIIMKLINANGTTNKNGQHVRTFLKGTGIVFRPDDELMLANHGIETIGDWCAYSQYLTHDTAQAKRDGKEHYEVEEIVSNLSIDEINQFREGYTRITDVRKKISQKDVAEIAKTVYELGYKMKDFYEWYNSQNATIQSHSKMKYWKSRYEDGINDYIQQNGDYKNRLCIFIQGDAGVGKTYTSNLALREMGYKKILSVGGGGTGKYDDLTCSTDALIIDDDTTENALHMTDSKIVKAYRRNSGNPFWTGNIVIVTSNTSFIEWARKCGIYDTEELNALRSRFYICKVSAKNQKYFLENLDPSVRGTVEQIKERYTRYKKFRDIFNKNIFCGNQMRDLYLFNDINEIAKKHVNTITSGFKENLFGDETEIDRLFSVQCGLIINSLNIPTD